MRLSHHYVVPHISTGRHVPSRGQAPGRRRVEAKAYMDAGELIPDDVVIGVVEERLGQDDTANRGFVLDGFPRTVAQAERLEDILAPRYRPGHRHRGRHRGRPARLASRRVCSDCGANYQPGRPPQVNWTCDVCGGEVIQREDDTEAAIRRRLELYERGDRPSSTWYRPPGRSAVARVGSPRRRTGS